MGKCVVKICNSLSSTHNKALGVTFHTIPLDEIRRAKWIKMIRLLRKETDWIPSKCSSICSKHFEKKDFIVPKNPSGHVRLSKEAIPVLPVDGPHNSEALKPIPFIEVESDERLETDDEIEEITETPRIHKMRKIINHLKQLSTARLKRLKNVSQKNKRLITENKKLKDIIKEMKKQHILNEQKEMQLNLNDQKVTVLEEFLIIH